MKVQDQNTGPWLPNRSRDSGITRAVIRSDADRAEIESRAPMSLLPASTIHACIRAAAEATPEKLALVHMLNADLGVPTQDFTYAQLLNGIERAACLFADISGSELPIVSVICPLVPEALIAIWAAETVGIANPVNPFLEIDAVVSIMNSIAATVLVTGTSAYGSGSWDRTDEIVKRVPTLRGVFIVGTNTDDPRHFEQALNRQSPSAFTKLILRDGADDATYMPTGGTTGTPKLVRQTQERQLLNAWLMGALNGAAADEVVGHGMPNFHVGGLVSTSLRAVIFSQTLVTLTADGFRNPSVVHAFWPIIRHFGITNIIATPTTAAALLADQTAQSKGHRLHTLSCGGSTIPLELLNAFHKRFGIYLRELWGMTEFHGVITGHPNDGTRPAVGSVGQRFAFHRVVAAKIENGRYFGPLQPGERGILIAQGPCIGEGYVSSEQSAHLFVQSMSGSGIWANTGDIGTVDEHGYVWVYGREKDLIIRGGHKLDPKIIEEALQHHPDVQISAAVGQPDAKRGEMPIAYVQLNAGAIVTAPELIAFCATRIPERAAIPIDVILQSPMPMTAVGKINKPALRLDALCRVVRSVAATMIGSDVLIDVRIDDQAIRTTAVIALNLSSEQRAETIERLKAAFLGFEFVIQFEWISEHC